MFKTRPIAGIFYLTESARKSGKAMGYHTDSMNEPPGRWWSPGNWLVEAGSTAEAQSVARLSQGRDPKSGRKIVSGNHVAKRAGFDLTFSAPKCFSALWVVSQPDDRNRLNAMLYESVEETLNDIFSDGLIEARRGKNGVKREAVKGAVAALYRHTTSRDGDPQQHIHAALLMTGLREDGTIGAINNELIKQNQMRLGAAFRLRLAEKLEAAGVPVVADIEHGFRIKSDSPELLNTWSKRRKKILSTLKEMGIESSKNNAESADLAAVTTRQKKSELPSLFELSQIWFAEAKTAGWKPGDKWSRMDGPPIGRSSETARAAAKQIVADAIDQISKTQSLFERREIEALALAMAVGRSSVSKIRTAIDEAMTSDAVVYTKKDELFTTQLIILQEREIVALARSRQNEPNSGFSAAAITIALADNRFSDEQREAIKHALSAHGIGIVEGGPGVGKTTCVSALWKACESDGRRLILTAPSWTATQILKDELGYKGPAFAIDKLLHDLKSSKTSLRRGDVILVDEAGMTSALQILSLLRHAARAGATVKLQGDSRQISSVNRGDPMALIKSAIGGAQIRTIRRQKLEWMRQASMSAQNGNIKTALEAYADHGAVKVATDSDAAIQAAASAFRAAQGQAVAIAATNEAVTNLNERLRDEAVAIGILTGPEISIQAIPRGQKNLKDAKPIDLALRAGDRLILGAEAKINDTTLRNAARVQIRQIDRNGKITIDIGENKLIATTISELQRAGRNGSPPTIQHAYCTTIHASQGATWNRTIWLTSHEDSRSALVAMTRHTQELDIIIDRSAVPRSAESTISLDREGMQDPTEELDERTDDQIVKAVGKSMEKILRPRNASDILGLPATGQTVFRRTLAMSETQMRPDYTQLLPKRHGFRRDQVPDAAPDAAITPKKTQQTEEVAETEAFKMLLKRVRDGQDKAAAEAQQGSRHDADANIDTAAAARRRFDAWIGNDDDTDGGAATMPQEQVSILDILISKQETRPAPPTRPFEPTWRPPVRPAPAHTTAPKDDPNNYSAPGM